jgi:subtilisin family serine protease
VRRRVAASAAGAAALLGALLVAAPANASNDPLLPDQWGAWIINAPAAWQTATGTGVVVAVIDSGSGPHPDLDANLLPGTDLRAGSGVPDGTDVGSIGHGTHVAGTIAAVAGNGIGIAGVAPGAKILPIRILGPEGAGTTRDLATAITAAVASGARIVNLSLGSLNEDARVTAAIADATARNVLVVAAAGNDGPSGSPKWPAANDLTLAVTALDRDGNPAASGQRGAYIDLGAPGVSILSTVPAALRGRDYELQSGSSMAAAFVSGTAAILLSIKPDLSVQELREMLLVTARDVGALGRDDATGFGMVDAAAAVAELGRRHPSAVQPSIDGGNFVGGAFAVRSAGTSTVTWLRCTEAGGSAERIPGSCRPIPDATGTTYSARPRDAQRFLRAAVDSPSGRFVTATTGRVMAVTLASQEAPNGTSLADLVVTPSRGARRYSVLDGGCTVRGGALVSPVAPATCRIRVRVAARAPYPALNTVLVVDVVAA